MSKKILLFIYLLSLILIGCSSSAKFSSKYDEEYFTTETNTIRVLLYENNDQISFFVDDPIVIKNEDDKTIAVVKKGNRVSFFRSKDQIILSINNKEFNANRFVILPEEKSYSFNYDGKNYSGIVHIVNDNQNLKLVNQLPLEEYLKGVIPAEMPMGNEREYYEALKAFTICARTYAVIKIKEDKPIFDVFTDTQDQVYKGKSAEHYLSNEVINDTRGFILTYRNKPALTFYHSTCGGFTENVKNVFKTVAEKSGELPYLRGVKDDDVYCSISPAFNWKEIYTTEEFLKRFKDANLISDSVEIITSIKVESRFLSGRVNELKVKFINEDLEEDSVSIFGNGIRTILTSVNGKGILKSNNFEVTFDENMILLNGKGFGHGVGLCQWGALYQSTIGIDYKNILYHYFPGTNISYYYD